MSDSVSMLDRVCIIIEDLINHCVLKCQTSDKNSLLKLYCRKSIENRYKRVKKRAARPIPDCPLGIY